MGSVREMGLRRVRAASRAALVIEAPFVVTLTVAAVLIGAGLTSSARPHDDVASPAGASRDVSVAHEAGLNSTQRTAPRPRVAAGGADLTHRASRRARTEPNPSPPTGLTPAMPSGAALASGVQPAPASGWGCAAALNYLRTHADPQFRSVCPASAAGRQAMTCFNHPPECASGDYVIEIAVPCPAAYMNEASNSWVLTRQLLAPIDPYGSCS